MRRCLDALDSLDFFGHLFPSLSSRLLSIDFHLRSRGGVVLADRRAAIPSQVIFFIPGFSFENFRRSSLQLEWNK